MDEGMMKAEGPSTQRSLLVFWHRWWKLQSATRLGERLEKTAVRLGRDREIHKGWAKDRTAEGTERGRMVRRTAGQGKKGWAPVRTRAGVGFPDGGTRYDDLQLLMAYSIARTEHHCPYGTPLPAEGRGGADQMWSQVCGWVWVGSSGARLGLSGGMGKVWGAAASGTEAMRRGDQAGRKVELIRRDQRRARRQLGMP